MFRLSMACSLLVCTVFLQSSTAFSQEPAKPEEKPVAKIIKAADYKTLQEALDSVPEAGGMVVLPQES